jgi:hypothetical protein
MQTALQAEVVRPVIFFEGEFWSGGGIVTVRLFTGYGTLTWNSVTWTGGGHLLSISPIGENAELRAEGFEVVLSGMPSGSITTALEGMRQGRPGTLWLGFFDEANAVIADPYILQRGRLDIAPLRMGGETSIISARYESILIDLDTPRDRRMTHEDLQIDHPGDLGFQYVGKLQDARIMWGGPGAAASPLTTPLPLTNAR